MSSKPNKNVQKPAAAIKATQATGTPQAQPAAAKGKFSAKGKLAILLGAISILLYANTLKNGFVLDDNSVIMKNTIVMKGVSAIPEILSTPYRHGFQISINDLYRPLTMVLFATEYQFFGPNPSPYHFFNVLLFAACVILLFLFLDKFFEGRKTTVAFIAALLFAVHPIHTEVVANIKSSDELLCFCFAFISLGIFTNYFRSGKTSQLLSGAAVFFLSLMSKETTITFLAILPLMFCFYKNENRKRGINISISAVVAAAIFLAIRFSVLTTYHANSLAAIDIVDNALANPALSFPSRIATAVLILGYYIKLLIVPAPLIADYSFNTIPFTAFSDPRVLLSLAVYIFLAAFSIRRFIKDQRDPYAFWIFFYLITLALFSNIPFLIGATMGERFLFFPSLSFCVVAGLLIEKWIGQPAAASLSALKAPKVLGVIIPVCAIYAVLTISRNPDWESNYVLYSTDVKKAPESVKLNYWLGLELELPMCDAEKDPAKQKQLVDEAVVYLRKALSLRPEFVDAQVTIGHAYAHNGMWDSAEYHDKMAIQLSPNRSDPLNNLAGVYFHRQQYPQAIEYYKKTIESNPSFAVAYANIAACYGSLRLMDSSNFYAHQAIRIDPGFSKPYEILAINFKMLGLPDSAKKYEMMAQNNNAK